MPALIAWLIGVPLTVIIILALVLSVGFIGSSGGRQLGLPLLCRLTVWSNTPGRRSITFSSRLYNFRCNNFF